MLEKIFVTFLDMSVKASLVILAVLLVRVLLRRMPKIFSYCLWAVVLLRLLCPTLIELPGGAVPEVPSVTQSYTPGQFSLALTDDGVDFIPSKQIETSVPIKPPNAVVSGDVQTEVLQESQPDFQTAAVLVGQYVWLAGLAVMAAVSIRGYCKLRKTVREAVRLKKNAYALDGLTTPFVMGLVCPKIYIPSDLTGEDMEFVLRHERHHIRRMDHVAKALAYGALCLHWFNPMVWVAFVLSARDMEMSCDEAVTGKLSPDRRADYSALLLRFSMGRATIAGAPLAFGEGDAGKRIRNLSRWKKPLLWTTLGAVFLCAVVGTVCLLDAAKETEQTEEPTGPRYYFLGSDVDAQVVFDEWGGHYDAERDITFRMEEYPGVVFRCYSGKLTAEKDGRTRAIMSGMPIWNLYMADLDGDGNRELCATVSIGSGMIDERIVVYDYADRMKYQVENRGINDFYLTCEEGKLVASRKPWEVQFESAKPVKGVLRLCNRQLTMVCGELVISGQRASMLLDAAVLQQLHQQAMQSVSDDYISRQIRVGPAVEYFLQFHAETIGQSVELSGNGLGNIVMEKVDDNEEILEELIFLDMLCRYNDCVYYDPAMSGRLFICSEYRDLGFDYVENYYRAVMDGVVEPHPETWVYELETAAIQPWP